MGDDASEREATRDEIAAMQELVRQAMREARSASRPRRSTSTWRRRPRGALEPRVRREVIALCSVLAEFDHGAIEAIPRSFAQGYDAKDRELLVAMYRVSRQADRAEHPHADTAAADGLAERARILPRVVPAGRAHASRSSRPTSSSCI
jgi:hypothetical protein